MPTEWASTKGGANHKLWRDKDQVLHNGSTVCDGTAIGQATQEHGPLQDTPPSERESTRGATLPNGWDHLVCPYNT